MKKKYTGREWSENRFTRFQLGLILALLLVNYAFNYESQRPIYLEIQADSYIDFIEQNTSLQVTEPPLVKEIQTSTELSSEILDIPLPEIDYQKVALDISEKTNFETEKTSYTFEKATKMELPAEPNLPLDEIKSKKPLAFAEKMPLFETCVSRHNDYKAQFDCTMNSIMEIIRQKLKYPSVALENGIEGTVVGSFVVNEDGKISEIKIERQIGFGLDEAVVNVFQHLPEFIPAEQNKENVRVKMHIPVKFKLSD